MNVIKYLAVSIKYFTIKMKRYSIVPITLYRCQSAKTPILRQRSFQFSRGSTSFDFKLGRNSLYNPAEGDNYEGPNGLSLRPIGVNLAEFIGSFRAGYIYQIPKDAAIPEDLILIHQRTDHYSLQTKYPIKPSQFCLKAGNFFQQQKQITLKQLKQKVQKAFQK